MTRFTKGNDKLGKLTVDEVLRAESTMGLETLNKLAESEHGEVLVVFAVSNYLDKQDAEGLMERPTLESALFSSDVEFQTEDSDKVLDNDEEYFVHEFDTENQKLSLGYWCNMETYEMTLNSVELNGEEQFKGGR